MTRKASIYHNGKRLDLETWETKGLFKTYVIDKSKWFSHIDTIKVKKSKEMDYTKAIEAVRQKCIILGYF